MKKLLTMMTLLLPVATPLLAQDDPEPLTEGYAKVHVEVKAVPADKTGSVIKLSKTTNAPLSAKSDFTLPAGTSENNKKAATIQISEGAGSLYLWTQDGKTDKTYKLAAFFLDDGDGLFDMAKDAELKAGTYGGDVMLMPNPAPTSSSAYTYQIVMSSSLFDVYATETEAVASTLPEKPQVLIYAYYSNGDFVGVADGYSNFGTAVISNMLNQPGDDITLTATPAEGYEFAYWKDALQGGNKVSTDNPLTTKTVGGRTYYAVFFEQDAPVLEFPEEGGYMMLTSDKNWAVDEFADFTNYVMLESDIVTKNGHGVFDFSNDAAKVKSLNRTNDFTWYFNTPNLCYGKGKVRMAYSRDYGVGRAGKQCIYYTDKNLTLASKDINDWFKTTNAVGYVYVWKQELTAFQPLGSTADGQTVTVPAGMSYMILLNKDYTAVGVDAEAASLAAADLKTPVTVSVGDDGVATLATEKALDFSAAQGLMAYRATVNGNSVTFHKVTRVPAGSGVLLRSLNGGATTEDIAVIAAATRPDNALKPAAATPEGQRYVLARQNGEVGFRPAAESLVIAADKAFLDVPVSMNAPFLPISGTTGVQTIGNGQLTTGNAYNLQGQRISKPQRGLYIVNGKKVVMKQKP